METFIELLRKVGRGNNISNTSYDTAWVARLQDVNSSLSNYALEWLCEHQLPDGSWGTEFPFSYHDRVVCTLSAMIALTHRGQRQRDRVQIQKGLASLEKITSNAIQSMPSNTNGTTVGFELIVPTLVAEAERLNVIKQQGDRIVGRLASLRELKMKQLNSVRVSRYITAAHSAEMAGVDKLNMLDVDNLQETNGSVACSPSATAYFAIHVKPGDQHALSYLSPIVESRWGGAPTLSPIEIFERVWTLWNLSLTRLYWEDRELRQACQVHLDYLERYWVARQGLGFSRQYSIPDADDTSMAFEVLSRLGRKPELGAVLQYEQQNWFRCFEYEATPSVDVNLHVLGALKQAHVYKDYAGTQKALHFIRSKHNPEGYWLDKWNLSPYYTTSHVVIAVSGFDDSLCEGAVNWILNTQKDDGSWGFFNETSTAEETAYCIQALAAWQKHTGKSFSGKIEQAGNWLSQHCEPPYPPLWIDKSLYCPEMLVKACILSALALVEESS